MMAYTQTLAWTAWLVAAAAGGPGARPPAETPATRPAGQTATRPATRPAESPKTTTRPTTKPAADPEVDRLLSALEKAGRRYETIRAAIEYKAVNPLLGDEETRAGWVAYRRGSEDEPTKFRIHFDSLRLDDGPKLPVKVDYAYDGSLLTIARHRIKQINRYRVPRPQRRNPLKLGEGPFPMPFGQEADDMRRHFNVTTRPPGDKAPKGTDYLKLKPRGEGKLVGIEMWVDKKTRLPARIVTRQRNRNVVTVTFSDPRTNVEIDPKTFGIPRPLDYRETVENLGDAGKLTP